MAPKVSSNAQIVADYLDSVLRKDHSAVERYFSPNVEYIVNGTSHRDAEQALPPISEEFESAFPWFGLHKGSAEVTEFLERMHAHLEVTAYGPRQVISEGARAAAFGWFRLHSLTTNRTIDIAYAILFELQDGKITKYHFLENTLGVAAAFRSGGLWQVKQKNGVHEIPEFKS